MSLTKTKIETTAAPKAIGPYSQAISIGDLVFCSGQVPLNPETGVLEAADVAVQTRRVLQNVGAVLEAAGTTPAKIIKTTVFMIDLTKFDVLNKEYEAYFAAKAPGVPAPARSTVQVSALPRGSLVEIEAIAIK